MKARVVDPLEMLLRDKRLADARGKGSDALQLAENTLQYNIPERDFDSDDEESRADNNSDWNDEQAAIDAVRAGKLQKGSPSAGPSDDIITEDYDGERLFGAKTGKAINGIIQSDKQKQELGRSKQKIRGVSLWTANVQGTSQDTNLPTPPNFGDHPILQLLQKSLAHNSGSNNFYSVLALTIKL